MALGPKVALPGDVRQAQLWYGSAAEVHVVGATGAATTLRLDDQAWVESPLRPPRKSIPVVLTAAGVAPASWRAGKRGCAFSLATLHDPDGIWRIHVATGKGKPFVLDTRFGAGLAGLPFP